MPSELWFDKSACWGQAVGMVWPVLARAVLAVAALWSAGHGLAEDGVRAGSDGGTRRGGKVGRKETASAKKPVPKDPEQALYEAKCGRCHEPFAPGVSEMTWNRWIWKWKDKARLTDEEYDRLMVYARREREARAAKLAEQGAGK